MGNNKLKETSCLKIMLALGVVLFFHLFNCLRKTSIRDYEKLSTVTYPFYFINGLSMNKTNYMQRIKQISTWEVFKSICPLD